MDKSKRIFGNEMSDRSYRKAMRTKEKFARKYGDDGDHIYHLRAEAAPAIGVPYRPISTIISPSCPLRMSL